MFKVEALFSFACRYGRRGQGGYRGNRRGGRGRPFGRGRDARPDSSRSNGPGEKERAPAHLKGKEIGLFYARKGKERKENEAQQVGVLKINLDQPTKPLSYGVTPRACWRI